MRSPGGPAGGLSPGLQPPAGMAWVVGPLPAPPEALCEGPWASRGPALAAAVQAVTPHAPLLVAFGSGSGSEVFASAVPLWVRRPAWGLLAVQAAVAVAASGPWGTQGSATAPAWGQPVRQALAAWGRWGRQDWVAGSGEGPWAMVQAVPLAALRSWEARCCVVAPAPFGAPLLVVAACWQPHPQAVLSLLSSGERQQVTLTPVAPRQPAWLGACHQTEYPLHRASGNGGFPTGRGWHAKR